MVCKKSVLLYTLFFACQSDVCISTWYKTQNFRPQSMHYDQKNIVYILHTGHKGVPMQTI